MIDDALQMLCFTRYWVAQYVEGVRVHGAELRVHFSGDGERVEAVNGAFLSGEQLRPNPVSLCRCVGSHLLLPRARTVV